MNSASGYLNNQRSQFHSFKRANLHLLFIKTFQFLKVVFFSLFFFYVLYTGASTDTHAIDSADTQILASADAQYTVSANGNLHAQYDIDLTNTGTGNSILTFYNITVPFRDIQNLQVSGNGRELSANATSQTNTTIVSINMNYKLLKPGETSIISLQFDIQPDIGNSLSIPTSLQDVRLNAVTITLLGNFAQYIKISHPATHAQKLDDGIRLSFENPTDKYIEITYVEPAAYSYEIAKTYLNETDQPRSISVFIPSPKLVTQLTIDNISDIPALTRFTTDGNLELIYEIAPYDELNLQISGTLSKTHIAEQPVQNNDAHADFDDLYWVKNDDLLRDFANYEQKVDSESEVISMDTTNDMHFILPQDVLNAYNFTVDALDAKAISAQTPRMGSAVYGRNTTKINSMDYADILISLLIYKQIPARMAIGYVSAYDDQNQDFFHTWVQFYDESSQTWIDLDPALGDLRGRKFIGNLSDHIPLFVRASSSNDPKLTLKLTKEVKIRPAGSACHIVNDFKTEIFLEPVNELSEDVMGVIKVTNTGNSVISKVDVRSSVFDILSPNQSVLLPGQEITIHIKAGIAQYKSVSTPTVQLRAHFNDNTTIDKSINIGAEISTLGWVEIFTNTFAIMVIVTLTVISYKLIIRSRKK